jgi:hypothetical protein
VKNIDCLPEIYRQRQVLRSARLWWGGVAVVFSLAIGGTAAAQWYLRHSLDVQLATVEPLYAISLQQNAEMANLQTKITQADDLVSLYLYLDHPWPRTQLLAEVAAPLPPSIRLIDLRLSEEGVVAPNSVVTEDVNRNSEAMPPAQPTAKSDLATLRADFDRKRAVLELSGNANKIEELHAYVDALAKSPLVAAASLTGLEAGVGASGGEGTKFRVRIEVRPGYGQPGAPAAKANGVTQADPTSAQRSLARVPSPERGAP